MWLTGWIALAAVLSAGLTNGLRRYLVKAGVAMSQPRERDIHTKPTPRLGGVAVTVSFLAVICLIWLVQPSSLAFVSQSVLGVDRNLAGIVGGIAILLIAGIFDDVRGLSPAVKFMWQLVAAIVLVSSGVLIAHITNPFGGNIVLGSLTYPIAILWVLVMINVINFLDGLDGLAGGVSLIAVVILYFLATKPEVGQYSAATLAAVLAGSLIGFLPFNFHPARIFLGDSGSMVLGFLLAVIAIISGGKLATAFLVLGVPILDLVWVVARRMNAHQPIYRADSLHLHHRLLKAGLDQREAVLLLYTVSAAFGIIALETQSLGKFVAAVILVGVMVIGGGALVAIVRRREAQHG